MIKANQLSEEQVRKVHNRVKRAFGYLAPQEKVGNNVRAWWRHHHPQLRCSVQVSKGRLPHLIVSWVNHHDVAAVTAETMRASLKHFVQWQWGGLAQVWPTPCHCGGAAFFQPAVWMCAQH